MGLKANNGPGLEDLYIKVLKEVVAEVADAMVVIFQTSRDSGIESCNWNITVHNLPRRENTKSWEFLGMHIKEIPA